MHCQVLGHFPEHIFPNNKNPRIHFSPNNKIPERQYLQKIFPNIIILSGSVSFSCFSASSSDSASHHLLAQNRTAETSLLGT